MSPSQRSNKNLFLIAAEDHELPRCCEGFIKFKIIDEEGNITQQTEIIVEPMKEFEDKSHLLTARSLNDMVDDVVWVRVLNPTLEPKKVYKNARIAGAENIEKILRVKQNNPDNNKKHRDEFDFEKHVNSSSMSLSCEEMTKVRSLCTKYEVIFLRNSNDMGFCDRIYHRIKLKKDAVPLRNTYGSMSFEKRKATKKIVDDFERDDLVEPTHSDWVAPSLLVPKKDGTYRLVVDYRGLNNQIEETCWHLPQIKEVIDSLKGNKHFSNIDILSGYFQMVLEEESQNVTAFITPLGLYKWKRLPIGLASAPGAFQNLMELIFAGLYYEVALVYLDDVIVFGINFEEHLKRLELVFQRLSENGLKIKGSKCNFFQKRESFLGHIISESGVGINPEKVRAVEK